MKFFKQKYRHLENVDEAGVSIVGDCYRTCIAMVCGLDRDDVPHFVHLGSGDNNSVDRLLKEWLHDRGLHMVSYSWYANTDTVAEGLAMAAHITDGYPYIFSGRSTVDNHCVIGMDDKIVWDPSAVNEPSGLIGPMLCQTHEPIWQVEVIMRKIVEQNRLPQSLREHRISQMVEDAFDQNKDMGY